tara:strand:- start:3 stop:830 length:828 start_codon:yes stop_codon:yes gene_type:complete
MSKESSLTAPKDRDINNKWRPSKDKPLTDEQTDEALKELNVDNFIEKYPRVERFYCDPSILDQKYSLVSFIPAKGASPDEDGIYGMIKTRGNYATIQEANQRAEYLIQNIDSYHKIYHCYTGRPFPATSSSKYSAETAEVDIKKKITNVINEDVKQKKYDEQKEINEIKEREKRLLEESKRNEKGIPEDTIDTYTTMRVKYAQLTWTYLETQKKVEQMKKSIVQVRKDLKEMDEENPEFIVQYREKYMKAREEAGLPEDDDSFMKYLGEDADLGF